MIPMHTGTMHRACMLCASWVWCDSPVPALALHGSLFASQVLQECPGLIARQLVCHAQLVNLD